MKKLFLILVLASVSYATQVEKPTVGSSTNTWGTELNNYLEATKIGISVTEYGAVGDDTTVNDDAIDAAIAALPDSGGVLIFPVDPNGGYTYRINTPIIVTKSIRIMGLGTCGVNSSQGVVIKNYGDDDAIWVQATGYNIVENLDIVDGLGAGVRTAGSGLRIAKTGGTMGSTESTVRNVRVDGHLYGIRIRVPVITTIQNCVVRNCDSHGFYLEGWPDADDTGSGAAGTSTSIINCFSEGNAGNGYHHDGQGYCHYSNCASDTNLNGYALVNTSGFNPSGITFTACGAEGNTNAGILLTNGDSVGGITIIGGKYATGVDGLQLNDADDVTLVGVTTASNTGYGINCDNTAAGRITIINNRSSSDALGAIKDTNFYTVKMDNTGVQVPSGAFVGGATGHPRLQFNSTSQITGSTSTGVVFAANTADFNVQNANTSGQSLNIQSATTTKTAMSGATVTATNLIPAGSMVIGVTVRVTTLIETATSFTIGDGSDADRWGTGIAVALNTTTGIPDFTIASPVYYSAATSVVLTATGGNFSAGAVRITVHYISITPPTS